MLLITPAQSLAFFRIGFFSILLLELIQLSMTPLMWWHEISPTWLGGLSPILICLIGICINIAVILGYRYRAAAFCNYIFCTSVFGAFRDLEYHMDYVYIGMSLFAIFVPLHVCHSVDAKRNGWDKNTPVSDHFQLILVSLGIGIIYFESVFYKLASPTWNGGRGYWMPATVPDAVLIDHSWMLDHAWAAYALGWLPIILEATLLFGIWVSRLRRLYLLGALLHIGILFTFPIPLFAIGELIFFVLLLPKPQTRAASAQCRFRTSRRLVYVLLILIAPFQIGTSLRAKLLKENMPGQNIVTEYRDWTTAHKHDVSQYLGIAHHPVFMDFHFATRSSTVAVRQRIDGQVTYLPGADETGLGDLKASGRYWVFRKFRFIHLPVTSQRFQDTLRNYLWTFGTSTGGVETYEIVRKDDTFYQAWRPGLLTERRNRAYEVVAYVRLAPNIFEFKLAQAPDLAEALRAK